MSATKRTEMGAEDTDERYLPALALALVYQPRANLQELAKAIGVSKATLYRFCPTREALTDRLVSHVGQFCSDAIEKSDLETVTAPVGLRNLIENHLVTKDYMLFLIYHWRPEYLDENHHDQVWVLGQKKLDAFFLKGQKDGVFTIDISAAAMTELFYTLLAGLIDAERRGRVARAGLVDLIELNLSKCFVKHA